ncbi:MAG: DNA repair exonuclease [Candidatus Electryonea clarkiae]|nr:DNA repair exonuclease [Candidatus Electryonea clarkiae]MDP8289268.1 DNA repair exonuclease [Candidatus Electryonea clarkiae]
MKLRILQTSDWHFGAGVLPASYEFDDNIHRIRENEEAGLLDKLIDIVKKREVDLILAPGDLWDDETIQFSVVRRIMEALGSIAPVPVFIVPGNHDFLSMDSPYRDNIASIHGAVWNDNIHIVKSNKFESYKIPTLPGISLTAMATGANTPVTDRLLASKLPRNNDGINILVFHGSRDTGHLASGAPERLITAPFSDKELIDQGFDFVALGHYHSHSVIKDQHGKTIGAYSGVPFQRDFKSQNQGGAFLFDIDENGVIENSCEVIPVDNRKYFTIKVNLAGIREDNSAEKRIKEMLLDAKCEKEDIVRIKVEGSYSRGLYWQPDLDLSEIAAGYFIDKSLLRPAFNLDEAVKNAATGSAQGVFLQRMLEKLQEESNKETPNKEKIRIIEMAVQMGYEAFSGISPEISGDQIIELDS